MSVATGVDEARRDERCSATSDLSVLLVHNHSRRPGGEDSVVRAESAMLRAHGHDVHEYRVHHDGIDEMGKARLLTSTIWNPTTRRNIENAVVNPEIGVAHFHNTFPLVSPSGYYAARRRAAVVQTLHNYRLLCPEAGFHRNGQVCEECLGKAVPWPALAHRCDRHSRATTAAVVGMLTFHRGIGTYDRAVDVYIALTEFARRKFIEGGLPADKIVVKPHFTKDPGVGRHADGNVLFVGRLTPEKGTKVLLEGWRRLAARRPGLRLTVIGDGPCNALKDARQIGVDWLGWQSADRIIRHMQDARVLVFPSLQREAFPMTIVEALATGLPVVASRFESIAELIEDGRTGRLYRHGDPDDLAGVLDQVLSSDEASRTLGHGARAEYENKYTPAHNYGQLMAIYSRARTAAR